MLKKDLESAQKAFRRILSVTSELGGDEHDFRPTTVGGIRRIAKEQIVRIDHALENDDPKQN